MEVSKPLLRDGDGLEQQTDVAVDLALLAVKQDLAQLVMSLESPCQTNLEDTRHQEANLPRWEMLCKCKKKSFRNFAGTIGWKIPVETLPTRR